MTSTFRTVLRNEFALLRAERSMMLALALFTAAAGYAVVGGRIWRAERSRTMGMLAGDARVSQRELSQRLDSLASDTTAPAAFGDPRSPYTAGTRMARPYAVLVPTPLSFATVGQSDLFPWFRRVSIITPETFFVNDELENPVNLVAGRFDLAFVAVVLFPLVILALTYNVLSADRESGTLALLLAQPASATQLVWAKVASRAMILVAAAIVIFSAGLVATGGLPISLQHWAAIGMWIAVTLLYGALWFALAMFVNVSGRSSATNALILLAFWVSSTVVLPSLINIAAQTLHPAPSRVQLVQAAREASDSAAARGSQLLGMYIQDHPELMPAGIPKDDFGPKSLAVQEGIERTMQPVRDRFDRQLARQEALVRRWRFASPGFLAYDALTEVAGTSTGRYRSYDKAVNDYMHTLHRFYAPMVLGGKRFTSVDLASLPSFQFSPPTLGFVVRRIAASALVLFLLAAVVWWAGTVRARNRSVLVSR